MKAKVNLAAALIGASVVAGLWVLRQHSPSRVLQRMSEYYAKLDSFEGVNTIVVESDAGITTNQKRFSFLRPNRFIIVPGTTNDSQLYCDGTNLYDYRPYYFNSYTKVPAPARFEDVITNWVGGELLRMITRTNRLDYLMSGFGRGLKALKYEGHENIDGIDCDLLDFRLATSNVMELWIARGAEPFAVKYAFSSSLLADGEMHYTETISGWKGESVLPDKFVFTPPKGAVERPQNANEVELLEMTSDGKQKEVVKFYSSEKVAEEVKKQSEFLKKNQHRFQEIALRAILAKYTNLMAGDLGFKGVDETSKDVARTNFVVTFGLPPKAQMGSGLSTETWQDTVIATLSADGRVEYIGRGGSYDYRSTFALPLPRR